MLFLNRVIFYRVSVTFTFMHLADTFIQSDLQLHSGYTFFNQYVCSLGIELTTFCAADAIIYHWATQEHLNTVVISQHCYREHYEGFFT